MKKGQIMRTKYFKSIALALLITSMMVSLGFAQPPIEKGSRSERGERFMERIPDLTDEQNDQIKELKTSHMKEVLPIRNQIDEKQAQLNTLSTAEKVDMAKINKTIEEIGELKVTIAKKRAAHRQQIRNLLTEDQRIVFDTMPMNRGNHKGFKGSKRGPRCGMRPDRNF